MESRRSPRIRCSVHVRGGGHATVLSGRLIDLSGTGAFIVTRKFVPVGKQVHLDFALETGPVEVVGEVRWVARGEDVPEQGLGIRFLRMSSASARAIDDAVSRR